MTVEKVYWGWKGIPIIKKVAIILIAIKDITLSALIAYNRDICKGITFFNFLTIPIPGFITA